MGGRNPDQRRRWRRHAGAQGCHQLAVVRTFKRRPGDIFDADVRDAIAASNLNTVVGPVKWGAQGPFKNVSKTPLVLGQWGKGKKYKMELVIVNDEAAKNIPTGGTMRLM